MEYKEVVGLRIPEEMYNKIKEHNISVSDVCRCALQAEINRQEDIKKITSMEDKMEKMKAHFEQSKQEEFGEESYKIGHRLGLSYMKDRVLTYKEVKEICNEVDVVDREPAYGWDNVDVFAILNNSGTDSTLRDDLKEMENEEEGYFELDEIEFNKGFCEAVAELAEKLSI